MERIDFLEDEYDDFLLDAKILGRGTESTVLEYHEYVLKVLYPTFRYRALRKKLNLLALKEELRPYLTLPLKEVYLEYSFIGYLMENAGISFKDYLLNNKVAKDKLIDLLLKAKKGIVTMHSHGILHGDIQFSNMMVKENNIKISDVNNVKIGKHHEMYMNEISLNLANLYGIAPIIDIQAFNYMCYILLNGNDEEINKYVNLGADGIGCLSESPIENIMFDRDVSHEQFEIMTSLRKIKSAKTDTKYLIDYLK